MIVDTGSSVVAFPCKELCVPHGCGKHNSGLYEVYKSTAHSFLTCDHSHCQCADNNRCRFYQGYAEGSYYEGYVVSDQIYFGNNYHFGQDALTYSFGCVKKETHYFYTQKVDGILGLSSRETTRTK